MAKTEVEEVLGAPINPELSEYAQKLRRNLLAFGAVYVFCWLTGVKLDTTSPFFGIKLIGLNELQFSIGTMIINAYLLIHFGWYAWEAVLEWRVRLTGTRLAHRTGARMGSAAGDYPDDPRQSTLYYWWIELAKQLGRKLNAVDTVESRLAKVEEEVKEINDPSFSATRNSFTSSMSQMVSGFAELRSYHRNIIDALNTQRVEASLRRFDSWFALMLKSQNLRMILIDISLPLLIGIAATGLNAFSLFCQ